MQADWTLSLAGLRVRVFGDVPPANNLTPFLTEEPADVSAEVVRLPVLPPTKPVADLSVQHVIEETPAVRRIHFLYLNGFQHAGELCLEIDKVSPDHMRLLVREDRELTAELLLCGLTPEALLHRYGRTILHASWVDRNGQALLFSGPSCVGKSTQASLWQEYRGCETVNGDRTGMFFRDGQAFASAVPFSGTSGICKVAEMPVRAVVLLSQGTDNHLQRLSQRAAAQRLLSQMPLLREDPQDVAAALEIASRLAKAVPVYAYSCTMDESAVDTLDTALKEEEL